MKAKSSAHYQREYRKRLREQGLVKKEVWIRPENAKLLAKAEKELRTVAGELIEEGESVMAEKTNYWTTAGLYEELKAHDLVASGKATIELIDGIDASLHIVMHEYGDLPVFLTVSGEQIIVESVLWPATDVTDVAGFNDAILRTHKYFPLSTVSLESGPDNQDYYTMFGALSSASILINVVFEIEVLASNVIQATEAYGEFVSIPMEA